MSLSKFRLDRSVTRADYASLTSAATGGQQNLGRLKRQRRTKLPNLGLGDENLFAPVVLDPLPHLPFRQTPAVRKWLQQANSFAMRGSPPTRQAIPVLAKAVFDSPVLPSRDFHAVDFSVWEFTTAIRGRSTRFWLVTVQDSANPGLSAVSLISTCVGTCLSCAPRKPTPHHESFWA